MADAKISALNNLPGASIDAGDMIPVVDVSASETKQTLMSDLSSRTETMTNKTLTSPVLTTPTLGVASATTINKVTLTAPASGSTLTLIDGKTFTVSKTMQLTAADDTGVYTFPTGTKTLLAADGAGTSLTGIPYTLTGTANQVVLSAGTGNITFSLPQSIGTASNPQFATIELGAASDTTLARVSAGLVSVEGITLVDVSAAQTLSTKTLSVATLSGSAAANGNMGRNTTQLAQSYYDNGMLGNVPKIIAEGFGTQNFTNSTATDQDFTSMLTFPANTIFTDKQYRVESAIELISGVSAVTGTIYLKIGTTKVAVGPAVNFTSSLTMEAMLIASICGRAAAGAAAATSTALLSTANILPESRTAQTVNLATNGTLTINWGITFSGTGSTETMKIWHWTIWELN